MKKYKLQDVVSNGSNARRNISSDLLVGDVSNGYGQGDILDANATSQMINKKIEEISDGLIGDNVTEELENLRNKDDEYEQRISSLEQSSNNTQVVGDNLIIGI